MLSDFAIGAFRKRKAASSATNNRVAGLDTGSTKHNPSTLQCFEPLPSTGDGERFSETEGYSVKADGNHEAEAWTITPDDVLSINLDDIGRLICKTGWSCDASTTTESRRFSHHSYRYVLILHANGQLQIKHCASSAHAVQCALWFRDVLTMAD